MKNTVNKLFIGASLAAGMSAIATFPAHASSLTGAKMEGTAPYYTYTVNGQNTVKVDNTQANVQAALDGSSVAPGGNVELFSNSETLSLIEFFNYDQVTTLSGKINGKDITISSLTAKDWFGDSVSSVSAALSGLPSDPIASAQALVAAINPLYDNSNLATQWFNTALSTYGITASQDMFNAFLLAGGFQRFSDPNISYVNQDQNGEIHIGLAGHEDARTLIKTKLEADRTQLQSSLNKVEEAITKAESVTTAQTVVNAAKLQYGGQVPTISKLQTDRNTLQTTLNALPNQNSPTATNLQNQIKAIDNLITAINATNQLPGQITEINSTISQLKTQKDELTSKIKLINGGLAKLPEKVQASEVVKVAYLGNPAEYFYSFKATDSGLSAADDGISHNGNYEVSFQGVIERRPNPKSTPEPSVMLGLLGVVGIFATQRKLKKLQA